MSVIAPWGALETFTIIQHLWMLSVAHTYVRKLLYSLIHDGCLLIRECYEYICIHTEQCSCTVLVLTVNRLHRRCTSMHIHSLIIESKIALHGK